MIRFYAYYSVAGYKEFYLGNNKATEEYTYFLPLLPVYKKKLENSVNANSELQKEVERLESLPLIKEITKDEDYWLPKEADPLFSHDGYSLIYKHLVDKKQVLAIRDIPSKDLDGIGREIPFTFCLVCDEIDDWEFMDRIATFFALHLESVFQRENQLASFLHMDSESNGLRFSQRALIQWLETSTNGVTPCLKYRNGKVVPIQASANTVHLLMKPNGMSNEFSKERQKIGRQKVNLILERSSINSDGIIEELDTSHIKSASDKKRLRYLGILGGLILLSIVLLIIL